MDKALGSSQRALHWGQAPSRQHSEPQSPWSKRQGQLSCFHALRVGCTTPGSSGPGEVQGHCPKIYSR